MTGPAKSILAQYAPHGRNWPQSVLCTDFHAHLWRIIKQNAGKEVISFAHQSMWMPARAQQGFVGPGVRINLLIYFSVITQAAERQLWREVK